MRIFSYIFGIILIILGLTFALLNATPVTLNYYIGTATLSLSLLLILTAGVGIVIGLLAALTPIFRLRRKNYLLKSRVNQLEQELLAIKVPSSKGLG